jgi:plastocyanin
MVSARVPVALAAAAGLLFPAAPGMAQDAKEIEKICAQAEKRYQSMDIDKATDDKTVVVLMYKYTFCPPDLKVKAGTRVRWINVDKRTSHSVWFKAAGKPESERLFPEETVENTFAEAGAYPYICGPHGEQEKMTGTVTVIP